MLLPAGWAGPEPGACSRRAGMVVSAVRAPGDGAMGSGAGGAGCEARVVERPEAGGSVGVAEGCRRNEGCPEESARRNGAPQILSVSAGCDRGEGPSSEMGTALGHQGPNRGGARVARAPGKKPRGRGPIPQFDVQTRPNTNRCPPAFGMAERHRRDRIGGCNVGLLPKAETDLYFLQSSCRHASLPPRAWWAARTGSDWSAELRILGGSKSKGAGSCHPLQPARLHLLRPVLPGHYPRRFLCIVMRLWFARYSRYALLWRRGLSDFVGHPGSDDLRMASFVHIQLL
jgi:hypothetical protein